MNSRTKIEFNFDGDIWPAVESWAKQNGFRRTDSGSPERTYQKGAGFLVAPMMFKVSQVNTEVNMEAWVRVNILARALALFIVPSEMGIEQGGFRLSIPRSMARQAVDKLLKELEQPPIDAGSTDDDTPSKKRKGPSILAWLVFIGFWIVYVPAAGIGKACTAGMTGAYSEAQGAYPAFGLGLIISFVLFLAVALITSKSKSD